MAKDRSARASRSAVHFSLSVDGADALWARSIERVAKQQGHTVEHVIAAALHDWLWGASGLKRMFEQVREAGELMTRSFQVEGMLVGLAKSAGISMGQQSEYLKRAQEERERFTEQRKRIARLVREIRRAAEESGLPEAVEAASKLVVPD
jgi:hypothetical protein